MIFLYFIATKLYLIVPNKNKHSIDCNSSGHSTDQLNNLFTIAIKIPILINFIAFYRMLHKLPNLYKNTKQIIKAFQNVITIVVKLLIYLS